MRELAQYVLRLVNNNQPTYSIHFENLEAELPEVIVMSICNGGAFCFHIAIPYTNTDIENAKAVCSQEAIYRSTDNDPLLNFAVYDPYTRIFYFCLLDPKHQTIEDVAQFQLPLQESQAAERLQACVASNAEVLR